VHLLNGCLLACTCRDAIWTKSRAAAGLCEWAVNIVKYFDVVSEVEPKRQVRPDE
jgi:dynein heavy chain